MRTASVLVVDDDPDHRTLISRKLRESGYRVDVASTGEDAMVRLDGVDLVLLDYKLGGRDGIDVLRQIRARPSPPAVIMVTGMGSEQVVIACIRAGASDYVIKDTGYLANLPTVVERAWRHYDLERRAGELQRLTLLVTSAPDRDVALHEIVDGALRLLAADRCVLSLADEHAGSGAAVSATAAPSNSGDSSPRAELRVPVSMPETGRLGELAVQRFSHVEFTPEERELASTFASFAAITVAKLRQLELERDLVAELQQTLDLRRQMVAGVSHELRTPLTAISGFAQTLLTHWEKLPDTDRREMVTRIRGNSKDLAALVEQLLDFAAVEAGRMKVDVAEVDIQAVGREAVADLAPLLAERTVVFDVKPGTTAMADRAIVRRTLNNLLTNAAKYTPPDSAIAVRAYSVDFGERVRIEVADTGEGIQPADASRVFEPFWRADSTRHSQRGTGIGLALVRDYARLMGGDAGVESTPGDGATFWVTLPHR